MTTITEARKKVIFSVQKREQKRKEWDQFCVNSLENII